MVKRAWVRDCPNIVPIPQCNQLPVIPVPLVNFGPIESKAIRDTRNVLWRPIGGVPLVLFLQDGFLFGGHSGSPESLRC